VQGISFVFPVSLHGFDFFQQDLLGSDEQSVNAPTDLQRELLRFHTVFNGQLGEIARRSRALDFLMAADAGEGAVGADELALAAKVARPQDELDQVAHRNCMRWF
jgi:hypothetical protein